MVDDGAWRPVSLGECLTISKETYSLKERWPFINYLETGAITDGSISEIKHLVVGEDKIPSRARRKVAPGDIVYSTVRPNQRHFGIVRDVPENFLASTGFAVLRGKEGIASTEYIYWHLSQNHVVKYLHTIAEHSTSAYPSIRSADIEQLSLKLPPLEEQRLIAHVLRTLDDKIELNRRTSETLEEMARALFKSWFVDFHPVRAKIERRWRPGGSLSGLPAHLYDLFPSRLMESDLGEIPEGWQVRTLGEMAELAYGKALKAQTRRPGNVPVYGSNGQVGWHDEKLVDGPGIVVGRKGNPGFVRWSSTDFYPIDTTFYVVPRGSTKSIHFLLHALEAQGLPSIAADSAVPGLNRNLAYMNRQVMPTPQVVEQFEECVGTLFSARHRLEEESRTLAATRDALLPALVSGELRVTN